MGAGPESGCAHSWHEGFAMGAATAVSTLVCNGGSDLALGPGLGKALPGLLWSRAEILRDISGDITE